MVKKRMRAATRVVYAKYQEAKQAVRRLGVKTRAEYAIRYKKDKKLMLQPHRSFAKKGWKDWYDFLGKKQPNFYPTFAQAVQAVRRMRVVSKTDYQRRYHNDFRLPSHPDDYYCKKGWRGWHNFLGKKK